MKLTESLLPEFDQEMANTRKTLERIADEKLDWRPHPKSYTMGELATHLANLLTWTNETLEADSLDMSAGGGPPRPSPVGSRDEALQRFDANLGSAREAIAAASDERMLAPWSLLANGETVLTLPRIAVLRTFVLSHSVHHRAQLGLYLRLNDLPVPAIYGPTADETA